MGNRESLVRAVAAEDEPDYAIPLLQASPAPGCIFDLDSGEILSINTAFTDLLDFPDGGDPAVSAPALFPRSGDWQVLEQALVQDGVYRGSDLALRGARGDTIPVAAAIRDIFLEGRRCGLALFHDIAELVSVTTKLRQNEERLSLALKGAEEGLWDWDIRGGTIYFSPRVVEMLGYADGEFPQSGRAFLRLVHPRDLEDFLRAIRDVARGRTDKYELEFRARHRKGHYVPVLSRGFGVSGDGGICRIVGTHLDISGKKRAERLIQLNERRFRALYDDSPAMFFTLDRNGRIRSVNRFGAEHLGTTVENLLDKPVSEFIHGDDRPQFEQMLAKCLESRDRIHRTEFRIAHQYQGAIWVRAAMRPITQEGRKTILVTCEDISETRILSEQLEYQAKYDSLTGLINRSEFERRLRHVLLNTSDKSEHALCYLDLDQFKVINDTCGHLAGDELLRRIGDLLNTAIRKRDTLARLGGDEFAVLLEHCPFYKAREIAEGLLDVIRTFRFEWEDKQFGLGASIGLVPIDSDSGTLSDILSTADTACYAAKDAGRNRVHIFNAGDDVLSLRRSEMQWVSEINNALEHNRLQLAVQSIVRLRGEGNGEGKHFEVLIRMEDREGNLVMPGSFLPAADKYNLSAKIDQWVVDEVFSWLLTDPAELAGLALCCINLSGSSISDPHFMNYLVNKLHSCPGIGRKICLEITETSAITNLGHVIKFMNSLKEIGCSFSLDDFGTGLSSFSYLKNLPVDYLKIDGSFIRNIVADPIDQAMVRSIHEIGRVMGKATIAEFVENEGIREVLTKIGVDYAQGYGIAQPVLLREFRNKN